MKRVAISVALIACAATLVAQQPPAQPMGQQQPPPPQQGGGQQMPEEPKNVQLLKGMTPGQLIRTMQFISASLGVSCDFCHVIQPNGDRDMASDDKKEKKTARQMIQLVMDTNSKYFENQTEVTCQTCHRGSTRPVSVPVLPIAAPPQRPAPPPQTATAEQHPAGPSRDEIVAKYTTALGKVDASTFSSMELKGVRETPRGNSPFDVIIAPGKLRTSTTMPDGEMVNVVNAGSGWVRDQRGTRAMQPQQVETAMLVVDAYRITLPAEIPATARVGREKDKIGDRDVWVISMPFGTDGRQRLFFDAQTGLLARRITYTRTPIGNIPQQTDFDDYRDVNGAKLPFVVRIDTIDPRGGATRRYSDINLKPKIEESMFAQPQ